MQINRWQTALHAVSVLMVVAGIAACDRFAHEPDADSGGSSPATPVPTKSDPRQVMPPGGPYASNRDREVTAKVRIALGADSAVDDTGISVSTVAGKVLLAGAMPQEQIAHAVEVARAVAGVKDVDNRLLATG